jgi:predicted RNase H-like nuclease (RuvC/YqgF family)
MEGSQSDFEQDLIKWKKANLTLKKGFTELKTSQKNLESAFDEMKQSQIRMEKGQERFQKEFVDILSTHSDRIIDHLENRTEALNKRVFKIEQK